MSTLKKVRVRAVVEYDVDMPSDWGKELILFHLNEGTRCRDHIVEELQGLSVDDKKGLSCLCMVSEYQLVEETDTITTKKDSNDS